jgi:hypothetical protein
MATNKFTTQLIHTYQLCRSSDGIGFYPKPRQSPWLNMYFVAATSKQTNLHPIAHQQSNAFCILVTTERCTILFEFVRFHNNTYNSHLSREFRNRATTRYKTKITSIRKNKQKTITRYLKNTPVRYAMRSPHLISYWNIAKEKNRSVLQESPQIKLWIDSSLLKQYPKKIHVFSAYRRVICETVWKCSLSDGNLRLFCETPPRITGILPYMFRTGCF